MTIDSTDLRVQSILLGGIAEAYGFRQEPPEAPCSRCGCAAPAAEAAECDDPDCPLDGRGRE